MAHFDFEGVFGDDYLHFYEPDLTPERNARETEAIWQMLSLRPGQTVLDIGCGHGRIANELARRGAHVIGLDVNARFLERARADAAAVDLEIEYVQGDMRALPWRDRFDAALIWYTTFGYFDEADNGRVLIQAAEALRPGGRLLVEQINRAALLQQGLPRSFLTERGDDLMIDLVRRPSAPSPNGSRCGAAGCGAPCSRCASTGAPNSPDCCNQLASGPSRFLAATASR